MNLLQSLAGKIQSIEQLGGDTAKAVNRSTPWGQANQNRYNAAHAAQVWSMPQQPTLGQLAGNGAALTSQQMVPVQPDIQGVQNPGYLPLQNSGLGGPGYTANLQPQQSYDQQSPQVGVTRYNLNALTNPGPHITSYPQLSPMSQLNKPLLQHLSRLQ